MECWQTLLSLSLWSPTLECSGCRIGVAVDVLKENDVSGVVDVVGRDFVVGVDDNGWLPCTWDAVFTTHG